MMIKLKEIKRRLSHSVVLLPIIRLNKKEKEAPDEYHRNGNCLEPFQGLFAMLLFTLG